MLLRTVKRSCSSLRGFHRSPSSFVLRRMPSTRRVFQRHYSGITASEWEFDEQEREFISAQSEEKATFRLTNKFVNSFAEEKPPFGFNGLGELVYQRTYSRLRPDGSKEQWYQTVERVVNGTYNMQKRWIEQHELGWNPWKAQKSAQEMYRRIFSMRFLPPGRGLWAMGSPITEDKMLYAALNNCAFVSTENIKDEPIRPFCFLMDASMLGVGVGFDTRGADQLLVRGPSTMEGPRVEVPDSREGWVDSVRQLLEAYFHGKPRPAFDYSGIRPAGSPIKVRHSCWRSDP